MVNLPLRAQRVEPSPERRGLGDWINRYRIMGILGILAIFGAV
jgi:hypothetical protein